APPSGLLLQKTLPPPPPPPIDRLRNLWESTKGTAQHFGELNLKRVGRPRSAPAQPAAPDTYNNINNNTNKNNNNNTNNTNNNNNNQRPASRPQSAASLSLRSAPQSGRPQSATPSRPSRLSERPPSAASKQQHKQQHKQQQQQQQQSSHPSVRQPISSRPQSAPSKRLELQAQNTQVPVPLSGSRPQSALSRGTREPQAVKVLRGFVPPSAPPVNSSPPGIDFTTLAQQLREHQQRVLPQG
ncbi:unnamed protein product, partial [Polarella glacialis]